MYGQGNYAPHFRHGPLPPPPPPPPLQQAPPAPPPPFQQAPPGPPHFLTHQVPMHPPPQPFQHGLLPAPPAPQSVHLLPSTPVNMGQSYLHPPPLIHGSAPMVHSYAQPSPSYPPQPMPPPPRMLPQLPPLLPHSQGQVLYRPPPPPPPGIQHVPTPPPPPPSSFMSITPTSFVSYGQTSARDAHPPSLPPPPRPPPPSSPPPLPPSPPPPTSPMSDFPDVAPKALSPSSMVDTAHDAIDEVEGGGGTIGEVGNYENKVSIVEAEALGDLPLPPPKPAEEVVRNIEVLCQFIAKIGPDFENMARAKEAGNPQFAFLFGGEPRSSAAIGHEYFQWMKRKTLSKMESHKNQEQNVLSLRTLKMEGPSQPGNVEDDFVAVSPAVSDMDMEDDVSQPVIDKGFDKLNKESTGEAMSLSSEIHAVREPSHAPRSTTEQLVPEVAGSGTVSCSGSAYLHDGEDDKDSSFIEDVSPARASPDASECAFHGSVRRLSGDSSLLKVSLTPAGGKTKEVPRVHVEDGSPFRLIQGYASDDSEEDDKKQNVEDINAVSASPTVSLGVSGLHQDTRPELYPNFSPKNVSTMEIVSKSPTDSSKHSHSKMPKEGESFRSSTQASSPSAICPGPVDSIKEAVDLGACQQDDKKMDDRIPRCEPSQDNDVLDRDNILADHQVGKHLLEEDAKLDSAMLDVDEFGRLVRKGASDGDSDQMYSKERHVKRGSSWSRSRSPQESRRRHRSRSPRRRDKRSRSRSWSPKRSRSKSPPAFRRTNVFARRDQDQPPECFNFNRGRCFRGASCRYLHRDYTRHMSRQQQCQDFLRDSVKYDEHDAAPFSEHDKTTVTEMEVEECNNFPLEKEKSLEMQASWDQSEASTKIADAGDLDEKDALTSLVDNGQPTVKNDTGELQVTDPVSQVVTHMLEPQQVGNVSEAPNFNPIGEERTQPPLESTKPLPADSMPVKPSPTPSETLLEQPNSGEVMSSQHPQSTSPTTISEPQNVTQYSHVAGPMSHPLPAQTSQSTASQIQAPTTQPYAGHAPVTQTHSSQSPMTPSYSNYVPPNVSFLPKEFPPPSFSAPPRPPPPLIPPRENLLPPATNYQSQPPPPHMFPYRRPIASDYHSHGVPPNPMWPNIPPPPSHSYVNALPGRSAFPSNEFPLPQHQQNAMPPRNDFNPLMRPYPPGEVAHPQRIDFHPQSFHPVESSHQPPLHVDEFRRKPLPMGNQQDHPFVKEDQFSCSAMPEGPQIMPDSQREHHFWNQSFPREEVHIPLPGQGLASSSSFAQGGTVQPQSLPNRMQSFPGDRLEPSPFSREEFSAPPVRDLSYSHHLLPYGQQHPASSNLPSNWGTTSMVDPVLQRYPSSFLDNKTPHLSNIGVPKMSISTHYNPFPSTFEQPSSSLKFGSSVSGQENVVNHSSKYDSSFNSGLVPVGGPGSRMTASPPNFRRPGEQFMLRAGGYARETSAEVLPDVHKQIAREPVAGDQYDPLFDSIEPFFSAVKKLDHVKQPDPVVNDADTMSKLSSLHRPADVEENSRQKGGPGAEHNSEVDEFGEVATDAEAGAVENESPQPVDGKEWSPGIPVDVGNTAAGEIEIDQVKSPGKSKKSKDSRSMKLFKIALADFVKEVLKPSWRQGNMSKEAFKTIVKKTVDKVSGAMPSHQIPKSQVKLNQYVESSQRKLTKLVMGYVDKYVKM